MSDPHDTATHDDGPHEGPIKTPKQLIWAVGFAFVVPVIVIAMLASYVTADSKPAAGASSGSTAPAPTLTAEEQATKRFCDSLGSVWYQ